MKKLILIGLMGVVGLMAVSAQTVTKGLTLSDNGTVYKPADFWPHNATDIRVGIGLSVTDDVEFNSVSASDVSASTLHIGTIFFGSDYVYSDGALFWNDQQILTNSQAVGWWNPDQSAVSISGFYNDAGYINSISAASDIYSYFYDSGVAWAARYAGQNFNNFFDGYVGDIGTFGAPVGNVYAGNYSGSGRKLTFSGAPVRTSSTGTTGQIAQDGTYLYLCTASSHWERAAIADLGFATFGTSGGGTFPSGAFAFWPLADVSDATGNGHDLTNHGASFISGGPAGETCLQAAGSSGYLNVGFDATGWTDFSFSYFACATSLVAPNIIFQGNHNTGANREPLAYAESGDWRPNGLSSGQTCTPGEWVHWGVSYHSLGGGDWEYKVYKNGTLISTDTRTISFPNFDGMMLGISGEGQGSNMKIWNFGIWNRLLDESEFNDLYNGGAGLTP